ELAGADLIEEAVEVDVGVVGLFGALATALPLVDDAAREAFVGDDADAFASFGHVLHAHDADGGRRASLFDALALVVEHCLDLAADFTGNDGISLTERAVL